MRNAIFRFLVSFFCGTITCSALAVSPAPLVRWLNERQSEPTAATPVLQAERRWKLCALYPSLKDAYWLSINYGMVQEAQRTNVTLKIFEAGGYSQLEGAWYDPERGGVAGTLCKYGNPNVLTLDIGSSELAQATSAHTALVEIERFNGKIEPVTAFDGPFEMVARCDYVPMTPANMPQ